MQLTFESRLYVREEIAKVQRRREHHARLVNVSTLYGERIGLGGGSRPESEQCRTGYPVPETRERVYG